MAQVAMNPYLFSNFSPLETDKLRLILQEVFTLSENDFTTFYEGIKCDFEIPGWNHKKWMPREVFSSTDVNFQIKYQHSPVIGIDLPSTFELNNGKLNKTTIAIVAQDSLRDVNTRIEEIEVGTPFGLEHIECRTKLWTRIYMQMADVLLELGYRVYFTDLIKIWVSDGTKKGLPLPQADCERFRKVVPKELETFQVAAVITWGKFAAQAVDHLNLNICHLSFPHPSGANNEYWAKQMGMPATWNNKKAYFQTRIEQELKIIEN